jgi:hypothetical protein
MTRIKRDHSMTFKAQVALTACMGHKALAESAEHIGVHPTRSQGKAEFAEAGRRRILILRDLLRREGHLIERRHVSIWMPPAGVPQALHQPAASGTSCVAIPIAQHAQLSC